MIVKSVAAILTFAPPRKNPISVAVPPAVTATGPTLEPHSPTSSPDILITTSTERYRFCQRRSDRLVVRATRSLCAEIQASAFAAVVKLVTIVGLLSGTATSTA